MKIFTHYMIITFVIMMVSVQPAVAETNINPIESAVSFGWSKTKDYALSKGTDLLKKFGKITGISTALELVKKAANSNIGGQIADRGGYEISDASTLVRGDMAIDIKSGDVTSVASGNGSVSDIKIGTIDKSQLNDVVLDVDVKDVTSVASGEGSKSYVKIGSIGGSKVDGTASINVKANEVASIASGVGSESSVALGSVY